MNGVKQVIDKRKTMDKLLAAFLLVCICLRISFCEGKPCTLKVFHEFSSEPIDGVCEEEFETPDCDRFATSFNRTDLPADFTVNAKDYSIAKPASLTLTAKLTSYQANIQSPKFMVPGMFAEWNSPTDDSSRSRSKGYLLIWKTSKSLKCRLFKFNTSNDAVLLLIEKLRFQYEIPYLVQRTIYNVLVYSIPPPKNLEESNLKETFVSQILKSGTTIKDYENPHEWIPSLSAEETEDGRVEARFNFYPNTSVLTDFEVLLLKRSHNEYNSFDQKNYTRPEHGTMGVVSFTNLEPDEYKVVVHVVDRYHEEEGKCWCWELEKVGHSENRYCMNTCGSVSIPWFNVTGTAIHTETTSPADGDDRGEQSGFKPPIKDPAVSHSSASNHGSSNKTALIVGIVFGVLAFLAILAAVIFLKCRNTKDTDPEKSRESPFPISDDPLKMKNVYIMNADDSPAHICFVEQFALFLKMHCKCQVSFPQWEYQGIESSGKLQWSRSAMTAADHILYVDSKMAEKMFSNYNEFQIFTTRPATSWTNQLFHLALDHIFLHRKTQDKLVILHYREDCGSWRNSKNLLRMQLPSALPDLLRQIHNLKEKDEKAYTHWLPLCKESYENIESGIGAGMFSALRRALYYTNVSEESGIGSTGGSTSSRSSLSSVDQKGEIEGNLRDQNRGESTFDPTDPSSWDVNSCITVAENPMNGPAPRLKQGGEIEMRQAPEVDKVTGFIPPQPVEQEGTFNLHLAHINDTDS